jgi:hypothetical protein
VLYDYNGNPVVVNGYELIPSELPYRVKYKQTYPTKKQQVEIGGYSGLGMCAHFSFRRAGGRNFFSPESLGRS